MKIFMQHRRDDRPVHERPAIPFSGAAGLHGIAEREEGTTMPSKQSEAVGRHWTASRRAMVEPDTEGMDDESWGNLTAEPRAVDYVETEAAGLPAMWATPKQSVADRVLLCMHGGGFIGGSMYTHRKMFGHLAKPTGAAR
jgi:epsilon-lactone hydrolase